jgi:hypothetical protein
MLELDLSGARPLGNGNIATQALREAELKSRLATYKGRIAGSYRLLAREDLNAVPVGAFVSPKIDGELWFLVLEKQGAFLANPRGNVITGDIPLLAGFNGLGGKHDGMTVIAGELHVRADGRRCRVGDLAALLAGSEQSDVERLCFAAFDLLPDPDQESQPYADRLARLRELIAPAMQLWVVETQEDMPSDELLELYEKHVASGNYEGLVVRSRDGMIYKVKPSHSIDAVILGYTVKADKAEGVRSILLGLLHENGTVQVLGACGNVGSADERKSLLARLEPLKADSRYRHASDSGGLYHFVKPALVAEIKVTDLQAEKSDGSGITSMGLQFDGNAWMPTGVLPGIAILHPSLVRLREDKQPDAVDARFAQVADWVVQKPDAVPSASLPASTLVRREAWKKETKGKVAVRKLVVWKTNKEQANPAFPAYVVHWTDYSAGRGTPLDREVRLAMEESVAMQLADRMIADNIKKGWEKVA